MVVRAHRDTDGVLLRITGPRTRAILRAAQRARGRRRVRACGVLGPVVWLGILLAGASPARAVVIASGDGTANTTAPTDDPGFANVGILNGLSAVYVGNGWVLTANHVGGGEVTLGGVVYPYVTGSKTHLTGPGVVPPDLAVVKIVGDPGLPTPLIATSAPPDDANVVMIGRGPSRGAPLTWMNHDGWSWISPYTIRWGTNRITQTGGVALNTRVIEMEFDPLGQPGSTTDEGQAGSGDSGGAIYWKSGGVWRLAGTIIAISVFQGQPNATVLYTNLTLAADLSYYRSQILAITTVPACSDGLDDDLDGLVDHPADPGCDSPTDASERSPALECDDGIDNDLDGLIDHPADPQCGSPTSTSEVPSVPISGLLSVGVLAGSLGLVGLRGASRSGPAAARAVQSSSRTR
jgi:hypothetical protein